MRPLQKLSQAAAVSPGEHAETVTELVHRHIRDKHHTTTDEELKNAVLDVSDKYVTDDNVYASSNPTVTNGLTGTTNSPLPNPYQVFDR